MSPSAEFRVLQPRLRRFITSRFGVLSSADVDDVCQQAWEALYKRRSEQKEVREPFPFLCQASRWSALRVLKRESRYRPLPDLLPEEPDADTDLEALDEMEVSGRHLMGLLLSLNQNEREVTRLLIAQTPRSLICKQMQLSSSQLDALWLSAREKLLEHELTRVGSELRKAVLKANSADRLPNAMRCALDRVAACNLSLSLELANQLRNIP